MPTKTRRNPSYAKRFARVLDFIDAHLDESLSLERLSRVGHFSRFHFHRLFSSYVGLTPTRYVQLARLRRASYRLAFNALERITDVALQAGFEHSESFSRAFKATFGQSPQAFRKNPDWGAWSAQFQLITYKEIEVMQVRIAHVEPVTVAVLEHRGDPALLSDRVDRASQSIRNTAHASPRTNRDGPARPADALEDSCLLPLIQRVGAVRTATSVPLVPPGDALFPARACEAWSPRRPAPKTRLTCRRRPTPCDRE